MTRDRVRFILTVPCQGLWAHSGVPQVQLKPVLDDLAHVRLDNGIESGECVHHFVADFLRSGSLVDLYVVKCPEVGLFLLFVNCT